MCKEQILACFWKTLHNMEFYGFGVHMAVGDGASWNLAFVKSLCGEPKPHPQIGQPKYSAVTASITHPYRFGERLFFMVCSAHQCKNMRNALLGSRYGGARCFALGGKSIIWKHVQEVYRREQERTVDNQCRKTGLTEESVKPDSWSKMRVPLAHAAMNSKVASEMKTDMHDRHHDTYESTAKYIQVWADVFGDLYGFADTDRPISGMDHEIFKNFAKAREFLQKWMDDVWMGSPEVNGDRVFDEEKFLAWQTYQEVSLCMDGFEGFAKQFFQICPQHDGYFLAAPRVSNQNKLEALFGWVKQMSGGNKGIMASDYGRHVGALATMKGVKGNVAKSSYSEKTVLNIGGADK